MNDTDGLIPTFEVGEKVKITIRYVENVPCPHCGYVGGDHPELQGQVYFGTITPLILIDRCFHCQGLTPKAEGWYSVWLNEPVFDEQGYSVPYTLLEKIKG